MRSLCRSAAGLFILVGLACGGGGGSSGSNSNPVGPPEPPPPPPPPPCSAERPQLTAMVEPEASSCSDDNTLSFTFYNGRCQSVTLDSISTELEGPAGGCPEFAPFDIELGVTVEPKETLTMDYVILSWCCNGCFSSFTCAWKSKIVLETSVGDFKAESDFFRKRFKSSCPSCPTGPQSAPEGSGPEIGCEPSVAISVH